MTTDTRFPKISRRILAARKRKGLTQEQLAEAVGTSRRHVVRWENGKASPTRKFQERLAEALDEAPEFFAKDADADAEDDEEDHARMLDALIATLTHARKAVDPERSKVLVSG